MLQERHIRLLKFILNLNSVKFLDSHNTNKGTTCGT